MSIKSRIAFRETRIKRLTINLRVFREEGNYFLAERCAQIIAEDERILAGLRANGAGKLDDALALGTAEKEK